MKHLKRLDWIFILLLIILQISNRLEHLIQLFNYFEINSTLLLGQYRFYIILYNNTPRSRPQAIILVR
mgnify:CR=1 FL=1